MLLTAVACAAGPASPPVSRAPAVELAPDAVPSSLAAALRVANAMAATSVRVDGNLALELDGTPLGSWRMSLLVTRAGGMRLSARAAGNDFEMASDGATVWIRAPDGRPEPVAAGGMVSARPDRPWTLLDPLVLTDALLPRPIPAPGGDDDLLVLERRPGEAVVDWLRRPSQGGWSLVRRVAAGAGWLRWTERFDRSARLVAVVEYSGPWLPSGIASGVQIRQGGAVIRLQIGRAEVSPAVTADTFRLR